MWHHILGPQRTTLWRTLSFHLHVDSGDQVQVAKLTHKHLFSLSHLSSPIPGVSLEGGICRSPGEVLRHRLTLEMAREDSGIPTVIIWIQQNLGLAKGTCIKRGELEPRQSIGEISGML